MSYVLCAKNLRWLLCVGVLLGATVSVADAAEVAKGAEQKVVPVAAAVVTAASAVKAPKLGDKAGLLAELKRLEGMRLAQRGVGGGDLKRAIRLARDRRWEEASQLLFPLISRASGAKRNQLRYLLGLALYNLKFYQASAFQFMSVVRHGRNEYVARGLEKLSLAADALGDDTLLNYAIGKIRLKEFPPQHVGILRYRLGQFYMRKKEFSQAARSFRRVPTDSHLYGKSKYLEALSLVELGRTGRALDVFKSLVAARSDMPVTDDIRVAALLGMGRTHYQRKEYKLAEQAYKLVPRDSPFWHATLLEISWTMVRQERFRRALGYFQTLHSSFYEDWYMPETLLVRALLYYYICQFGEMRKSLEIFQKIYEPEHRRVTRYLKTVSRPEKYFEDIVRVIEDYDDGSYVKKKASYPIPFLVAREVLGRGNFQGVYDYVTKLLEEYQRLKKMPSRWQNSGVGRHVSKVLARRLKSSKVRAGRMVRRYLLEVRQNLVDFFAQKGLLWLEMLEGDKRVLRRKIEESAQGQDARKESINRSRGFYIQNGYQLWSFRGEYWLDELGNYFYVGRQSCRN